MDRTKDGASDEARTRYLHLGKVALYQMSYTRINKGYYSTERKNVKGEFAKRKIFFSCSLAEEGAGERQRCFVNIPQPDQTEAGYR